jgi:hypothetical protein
MHKWGTAIGRMAGTKSAVHVADLAAEQAYIDGDPGAVTGVKLGGVRTLVVVPMIKAGELIGALADLPPGGSQIH